MTFDKVSELNYFLLRDQPSVGTSYGKLDINNILFIITIIDNDIKGEIRLLKNNIVSQLDIDNIQIAYNRLQNDIRYLRG